MELTREIYWNVGHGAATLLPMYLLTALALAVLAFGVAKRLPLYRVGRPLNRFDQPGQRLWDAARTVLTQSRVTRGRGPGFLHALFFWGFALLFVGTLLIVLQADFTDLLFDVVFLKGPFYLGFSLILDLSGLVAILMLVGLALRRIRAPLEEGQGRDTGLIYGLLFAILLTGFLIEGARMAVTERGTALSFWSPIGLVTAKMLAGLGEEGLGMLHRGLWWVHLVLALMFIALLPYTRLRHILTIAVNGFVADRGPVGKLVTLDLEQEDVEQYGARHPTDLTWKDLFDTDACIQCRRCQDRCPAHLTEKPLSPMQLVNRIGAASVEDGQADLIEVVGRDALWSCTTCRACQDICPAAIEHVPKIVELRRNLVLMEGEFPGDEVMAAMEQTEVNGNPLGMGYATRADWSADLPVVDAAQDQRFDVLYFVGCYASYDKRNRAVARSFVTLCQAAGLRVGILGKQEKCCGEPVRKMGNEYLYQTLAMENIAQLDQCGASTIVTTCPHCYNTLTKDYRDLGLEATVIPHAVFLADLVASGTLAIDNRAFTCTYHDSCYLGRHNGIYAQPRQLIEAAGGQLVEMSKHRDQAFCCGAGGGRILAEEKLGSRINNTRAEMAGHTGASQVLANCPFCLTMFEDGIKGAGLEEQLRCLDIAEVLVQHLQEGRKPTQASQAGV
jgi:Fe-S oxidoreductase/nitrate reductase gamma subunit